MFDKKEIEEYRRIKAPESLRDRVMAMAADGAESGTNKKRTVTHFRAVAALAACVLLFAGIMLITLNRGSADITVGGAVIGNDPVSITVTEVPEASRSAEISITLGFSGTDAEILASAGVIGVDGERSISVSRKADFTWTLPVRLADGAYLTVTENGKTEKYSVSRDGQSNWTITKIKE